MGWSFSLGEGEGGFVVADCKMDGFLHIKFLRNDTQTKVKRLQPCFCSVTVTLQYFAKLRGYCKDVLAWRTSL